ncbi:hypothetical protein [Rhizobium sp. BR 315]|uniref:hypothetical protein n=1 Tax=Rhizobium sp. BR 315 TaxID=3040014 RepID=UPI003D33FFC2
MTVYVKIASQARYRIEGGDMLGWTAGAKLAGGNVNFDMGYWDVLGGTVNRHDSGHLVANTLLRW